MRTTVSKFKAGTAVLALAALTGVGLVAGPAAIAGHHAAPAVEHGTPSGLGNSDRAAVARHGRDLAVTATPLGAPPKEARAHRRNDGGGDAQIPAQAKLRQAENEENSNPTSSKLMTSHGGVQQSAPRIYLVFWGSSWFNGGDPSGVANRLHYTFQGLNGSTWSNVLKQYGVFTNPASQYKGWIQDTTALPSRPTTTDIRNAALRAAAKMNDSGYNAQYVIALPNGVVDQYSLAGTGACGWHNWTAVPGTTNWTTYTSLPYLPYLKSLKGWTCGAGSINGANGALDGVSIVAGHEYAETVNDPHLNAYYDSDGGENGDKCAWTNLSNYKLANGYTFPMQPTWSNAWRNTYGYGCYYS